MPARPLHSSCGVVCGASHAHTNRPAHLIGVARSCPELQRGWGVGGRVQGSGQGMTTRFRWRSDMGHSSFLPLVYVAHTSLRTFSILNPITYLHQYAHDAGCKAVLHQCGGHLSLQPGWPQAQRGRARRGRQNQPFYQEIRAQGGRHGQHSRPAKEGGSGDRSVAFCQ